MYAKGQTLDWARNAFVHFCPHRQYIFLIKKVLIKWSGYFLCVFCLFA